MPDFERYSKAKGISILKKRKEGITLPELAEEYGVTTRSISNWIARAIADEAMRKKKAKQRKNATPNAEHKHVLLCQNKHEAECKLNTQDTADKAEEEIPKMSEEKNKLVEELLMQEIAYLRWWKEGEMRGWVKRLLTEWDQCQEESHVKEPLQTLGVLRDPKQG